MAPLRSYSSLGNQESDGKASSPMEDQLRKWRSSFGFYSDSDMLVWLKGLALDPCDRKNSPDSARKLLNQSLKVRKLMLLGNAVCPRSKRKLDKFLKGSKFVGASGLATNISDGRSAKRMVRGSSVSCLTSSNGNNEICKPQLVCTSLNSGSLLDFEDEYQGKPGHTNLIILDDMEKYGPSCKDNSAPPLIDTDESANGLNTSSPENLNFCDASIVKVKDSADSPDSLSLDEDSSELVRALRLLVSSVDYLPRSIPMKDINGSANHSASLRSEEQNASIREALRLLFSDGKCSRAVVPIGPRFQAGIPEWRGPVNGKNIYSGDGDSEVSKWLGTRMWPIEEKRAETTSKAIGKGRSNSCSCVSPGSVDCVKHHIHEASLHLQSEIGPAFWSWKFDEMGEVVSKSWTLKEQRTFESLVKRNPLSSEASFWKLAFKRFPSKCRKSIVRYYYNVSILRRMSLQTRSSLDEFDSDED